MSQQHRWIAVGAPTGTETGSQANPYLANTPGQFDQIMRDLSQANPNGGYYLHLGPGTFYTLGLRCFPTTTAGLNAHAAGINKDGDLGWYVLSDWTISGAGEAATTIKLEHWPSYNGQPVTADDWAVIGCGPDQPAANVLIKHLTVDGNWDQLYVNFDPLAPPPTGVGLHGAAIFSGGAVRFSRITAIGFHSSFSAGKKCYGLATFGSPNFDPFDAQSGRSAAFEHCTVHGGDGDFCGGIGAIHYGPSIISNCTIYSLANSHSGAIEVRGRDMVVTNNFLWNCYGVFSAVTGNIVGLQMDNNRFIATVRDVLHADSTASVEAKAVWINVRKDHSEGSSVPTRNINFHGTYVDVPIRPLTGTGAGNPLYRIRLWLSRNGVETGAPPPPTSGILVKCAFTPNSDNVVVDGETLQGCTKENLEGWLGYGLTTYWQMHPSDPALTSHGMDGGAIRISPTAASEWIWHSQGAPLTSDESKLYIQSGPSWSGWRIRNNYFELPFKPSPTYPDQNFIRFIGNGSTDKDYHISNNLGRFIGDFPTQAIPTFTLQMKGIDGVTVMDNAFDAETDRFGAAEFLKAESTASVIKRIDNLSKRGNRNLYEKPIQTLLDDFHDWGS